jgi:hypothetical protein
MLTFLFHDHGSAPSDELLEPIETAAAKARMNEEAKSVESFHTPPGKNPRQDRRLCRCFRPHFTVRVAAGAFFGRRGYPMVRKAMAGEPKDLEAGLSLVMASARQQAKAGLALHSQRNGRRGPLASKTTRLHRLHERFDEGRTRYQFQLAGRQRQSVQQSALNAAQVFVFVMGHPRTSFG